VHATVARSAHRFSHTCGCIIVSHNPYILQADNASKLEEQQAQLTRAIEQRLSESAELNTLRQQARELSGVTQELQQTRQTLTELQAVAQQLEQHRRQISSLADQRGELQAALQQRAELTAQVELLQRDYNDMVVKANHAAELQAELPKLRVSSACLRAGAAEAALPLPATAPGRLQLKRRLLH
jgi:DNA repair exonuclease SbcCD ATPase subunit